MKWVRTLPCERSGDRAFDFKEARFMPFGKGIKSNELEMHLPLFA